MTAGWDAWTRKNKSPSTIQFPTMNFPFMAAGDEVQKGGLKLRHRCIAICRGEKCGAPVIPSSPIPTTWVGTTFRPDQSSCDMAQGRAPFPRQVWRETRPHQVERRGARPDAGLATRRTGKVRDSCKISETKRDGFPQLPETGPAQARTGKRPGSILRPWLCLWFRRL